MAQSNGDEEIQQLYKNVRNNSRMILYNDQIGRPDEDGDRNECHRDDLWAISTEELNRFRELAIDRKQHELEARIDEVEKARDDYRARVPDVFDRDVYQVKYFQDRLDELKAEREALTNKEKE